VAADFGVFDVFVVFVGIGVRGFVVVSVGGGLWSVEDWGRGEGKGRTF
jgi:hypothetical protein